MKLSFFNDNTILAPLKCGTRYLIETFGEESSTTMTSSLNRTLYHQNVKVIVVRPPYEHLESALHTEIIKLYENSTTDSESDIKNVLDRFKSNANLLDGATHWSYHVYEKLYWYWRRNRKYIKVIELKDLTTYLKTVKKKLPKYNADNYTFNHYSYWCPKEDIMLFVKENYKSIWDDLMEQVRISNKWYELLITETPIEIRLI